MRIYNGNLMDVSDIRSNSYLQINSCGIQLHSRQENLTFRKEGRNDYHIVYIAEGACEIEYDGKTILLQHGFVLYPPHMPQRYMEYIKTKKLWIHFNGYCVEEILKEAGLRPGVYPVAPSPIFEKLFIQLTAEHNRVAEISNEKGLLLSFLNALGRTVNNVSSTNHKIEEVISFLTTHYNMDISIKELADSCGLSQSRFLYLFKQKAGQSPHTYQQMLRINNCAMLLTSTELSVTEIGMLSGYTDPLYFSRVFKKLMGISPRQYRQQYHPGV